MREGGSQPVFKRPSFIVGCVLILLFCFLYPAVTRDAQGLLSALDAQVFSAMFGFRGETPTTGRVVIVDIDEQSLAGLGQWPWSRDVLAALVARLREAGASVVGLDMVFPEKDRASPLQWLETMREKVPGRLHPEISDLKEKLKALTLDDYDTLLGDELFRSRSVTGYAFLFSGEDTGKDRGQPFSSARIFIASEEIGFNKLLLPRASGVVLNISQVAQSETEGFINVFPDVGGTIHRVPTFILQDAIPYPSLALEMVRLGLEQDQIVIHPMGKESGGRHGILGISLGDRFIPTDTRGRIAINYRGGEGHFTYVSALDILQGRHGGRLKDKLVIVGTSAAGLPDLRATPFSNVFPGAEVQATIIDNILAGDALKYDRFTDTGITLVLILVGGLSITLLLASGGPIASALCAVGILMVFLGGNYYFLFLNHRLVGVVYPLVSLGVLYATVTLVNYFTRDREKRFIYKAFSHYLSPRLIDELVARPEKLSLAGEEKRLTVFFSDIRNFTSLTEEMGSNDMARLLNRYLTAMGDIVMTHSGMVDKYIGDAIVAIWGAPVADPDHAAHALKAAMAMLAALEELNPQWVAQGFPALSIGIGLNTDVVNVGNFGSTHRFDYTVIGNGVNLASRLESLNKYYGTSLLISEATRKAVGPGFFCRHMDTIRVKGMTTPVCIFEPVCEGEPSRKVLEESDRIEIAVAHYSARRFRKAQSLFKEDITHPMRKVYLKRIDYFLENPPPEDWDGVFTFQQK